MKIMAAIITTLLIFSAVGHCEETETSIFPTQKANWVNDFANLIDPQNSSDIEALCVEISEGKLAKIVVCTIESIPKIRKEYENVVLYGVDVFEHLDLEKDGVLILISKDDRKIAINTGYITEYFLPDHEAKRIIDTIMAPQFREENFAKVIIDAIREARKVMKRNHMLMYPEQYKK